MSKKKAKRILLYILLFIVSLSVSKTNARTHLQTSPKKVLAIQAANAKIEWDRIASHARGHPYQSWSIEELELPGFGSDMKSTGFQSALERHREHLINALSEIQPDVLLVSSKGAGVLTFLAYEGLWDGPAVLLSPIPNACDHIEGGSWESEWKSTLEVLTSRHIGPIAIGLGTSVDEQTFIKSAMEETNICGRVTPSNLFEHCPTWFLHSFPGNHDWKTDPENDPNIALLIDIVLHLDKKEKAKTLSHDGDQL